MDAPQGMPSQTPGTTKPGGVFSAMYGPMLTAVGQQRGFDPQPMLNMFDQISNRPQQQSPVLQAFHQRQVPGGHR